MLSWARACKHAPYIGNITSCLSLDQKAAGLLDRAGPCRLAFGAKTHSFGGNDLMGMMRFRAYPPDRITDEFAREAYLSGMDRTSWPTKTTLGRGEIIFERSGCESACLQAPWTVEGHGLPVLASGNLIERPEPYLLPLELARGTIAQVHNQLADWQVLGLAVPPAVDAKLASAVERFSRAAVEQENDAISSAYAEVALGLALEAADGLAAAYAGQAFLSHRSNGRPMPWLAVDLGASEPDQRAERPLVTAFNAAVVPMRWRDVEATEGTFSWTQSDRQIEWCRAHNMKVLAGPLVALDSSMAPDWLCLFEGDLESVMDSALRFIRAAVGRYRGMVGGWICAGRLNTAQALGLSEPERLQLAARSVEVVRSLDPGAPAIVSFDRPWSEYLRERPLELPAVGFADALIRAEVDLEGLMLEINVGYGPGCTRPRPILEMSRQLDAWVKLRLPLWISVCASGGESDELSAQQTFAARFVPLALAKPAVEAVVWNQLRDAEPYEFPHAGLFDAGGQIKPALRTLAAIRRKYLL